MKAKYKLVLGRRKDYPLNIELEIYKGVDCRVFLSTGIVLDNERQWDKERQLILRNSNAAAYNNFLRTLILNIERDELEAEEKHIAFTKDLIRMAAKNNTLFVEINVIDKLKEYQSEKKTLRPATMENLSGRIKKLQKFVDIRKGAKSSPLYFNDLTLSFIEDFDKYLAISQALCSRVQTHDTIKRFLGRAKRDGLIKYNPYDDFEIPHFEFKRKPSLSEEQVVAIENLSDEDLKAIGNQYDVLRDRFLFSCYTGLRNSDSLALKKSDITRDERGLTMQLTTIKTDHQVVIPLHLLFDGKPERIALKYLNINSSDQFLFPCSHKTKANDKLKRIFRLAGIPETYSFHTSRHTCATLLAEKVNDPFVIRDILGHTVIQTSMSYISQSHKTAERKLASIKWDGQTNTDNSITLKCKEIRNLCNENGYSTTQMYIIIGNLIKNPDKFQIIKSWVGTLSDKDCSAKVIDNKLQTLFNTL
ncbi:MAG: tyrosine-type recombinase/integrase [Bacteroidales bacterium]|nr:tyrosine-type recombinase/integrase [Bacteroidales bacterium]